MARYSAKKFVEAVKGSGGVVQVIAQRMGCTWHTARKWIDEYPTVKAAFDAEVETTFDIAESVVLQNIVAARKIQQEENRLVDTGDAKWYLRRKGKDRGYVTQTDHEISGKDGSPIPVKITEVIVELPPVQDDAKPQEG